MSDQTTETDDQEGTEEQAPEPDPRRERVVSRLRDQLGEALVDHAIERGDVWVRVESAAWLQTARVLKENLGFEYFCFLSAIDWLRNPELSARYEGVWPEPGETRSPGERPEGEAEAPSDGWETGLAGGETRFQVFARLYDTDNKVGITVKSDLDSENPTVDSISRIYRGADWHERETWEMFGVEFPGHAGIRHMYLPADFEGFPLRKDFPLLARVVKPWPGLVDKEPVPGEDDEEEEEGG